MTADKTDPIDVLIIGAGASGGAIAWSLADTKMRIVCMEQGGTPDPTQFPSNFMDWEERRNGPDHISPNVRQAPSDYPISEDNSPIKIVNYNGVGGGTVLFAGHFPRLKPSDFRVKTLDGVADDWPIDYETLEPFFAVNDRMMGVSGLPGDTAYPPDRNNQMPPVPLGRSGEALATWPYYFPPHDWIAYWIENIRQRTDAGTLLPFAVLTPGGDFVGMTAYLSPDAESKNVEIGMTIYDPDFQGGAVNPAAKRLLLGHAFDQGAIRVQFNIDQRNQRSQAAVRKLGAVQDGVLRDNRILPNGVIRSTVVFSILDREWPEVKARLDARLAAFG